MKAILNNPIFIILFMSCRVNGCDNPVTHEIRMKFGNSEVYDCFCDYHYTEYDNDETHQISITKLRLIVPFLFGVSTVCYNCMVLMSKSPLSIFG